MNALVLMRWIVPVGGYGSARDLIEARISPAVRASGWLCSPHTTHHVSDEGNEAWLTVVTRMDRAEDVAEDLAELLGSPPAVETTQDVLLSPGAEEYRGSLQEITHVGLDVLAAGGVIPLTEYESLLQPSTAAPRLIPFLNETSDTYRRACSTYESTERFWLSFFRWGPTPDLSHPGHWLWNLAG